MPELTEQQEQFCQEYLRDLNASRAAEAAGYSKGGRYYYQLLEKPHIRARIRELQAEQSKRTQVKADDVIRELAGIAFADLGEIIEFGPHGVTLKPMSEVPPSARKAIASITSRDTRHGVSIKVSLSDKLRALELLMRHLGMLDRDGSAVEPPGEPVQIVPPPFMLGRFGQS